MLEKLYSVLVNIRFPYIYKCYKLGKLILIGKIGNTFHEIIDQKA